jgi:hypothetical protein
MSALARQCEPVARQVNVRLNATRPAAAGTGSDWRGSSPEHSKNISCHAHVFLLCSFSSRQENAYA